MSEIEGFLHQMTVNRTKTLSILDDVEKHAHGSQILAWRPAPGRAHIAWQLMHTGVTEEMFASSRVEKGDHRWPEIIERYRGGSTPDDNIPSFDEIRTLLAESRQRFEETFRSFDDSDLTTIPAPMAERNWTLRKILQILCWHEPHHQGQAHITRNLAIAALD